MRTAFLLASALFLAPPAVAGELIPELVPAEARWLAHVDLEAMQQSLLFQELSQREDFQEGLREMRSELGVAPLELIRSMTVYSESAEPETGVAILVVSPEAESVLQQLQQQPGYERQVEGDRVLHSWADDGERVYAHVRRFEGVQNRLVFLSNERPQVLRAVQVLDGQRRSVNEVPQKPLAATPRQGSFFYFETSEDLPGMDGIQQMSAIATLARGLRFEMGELAGRLSADLVVTAETAGDAQRLTDLLRGLTALAGLIRNEPGGAQLSELVGALRFNANGNQVGVSFLFDTRRLLTMLSELEELDD